MCGTSPRGQDRTPRKNQEQRLSQWKGCFCHSKTQMRACTAGLRERVCWCMHGETRDKKDKDVWDRERQRNRLHWEPATTSFGVAIIGVIYAASPPLRNGHALMPPNAALWSWEIVPCMALIKRPSTLHNRGNSFVLTLFCGPLQLTINWAWNTGWRDFPLFEWRD